MTLATHRVLAVRNQSWAHRWRRMWIPTHRWAYPMSPCDATTCRYPDHRPLSRSWRDQSIRLNRVRPQRKWCDALGWRLSRISVLEFWSPRSTYCSWCHTHRCARPGHAIPVAFRASPRRHRCDYRWPPAHGHSTVSASLPVPASILFSCRSTTCWTRWSLSGCHLLGEQQRKRERERECYFPFLINVRRSNISLPDM